MSEDFGLLYASTFTGSMIGTSPVVFAVWAYVVANGYGGEIDLHPKLLAAIFGTTEADVVAAIRLHCAPDPDSRSDADEGRRLRHIGGVRYEIINHELYKNARALEEKRAYNRAKKRESRERQRAVEVPIFDLSKSSATTADALVSSVSALPSGSDLEGVQGDRAPPPELHTRLGDWAIPPELYDEAEREHGIDCDTLDFRVRKVRNRRIPGDGVWDRTEYVRGLLPDWSTWGPKPRRASSPPPASRRPPWVDDSHAATCRTHGWELATMAREFARSHHVPPDCLRVGDARAAFTTFLASRAGPAVAAA